jgi:hypothetical protein
VRIDGESMPALYSTSHLIACDFPPLKGDPKAEAPAGRGEEQVNQAMIAAMAASLEQNRQLADLYGVPMSACTVFRLPKEWDDSDYEWESSRTAGMIHLHPRDDGKYERIDHA